MSDISAVTYQGSAATTPSDTTADPLGPFAGFLVSADGTVSLLMLDNSTQTFGGVTIPAGSTPFTTAFKRVNSTGTTATVVGLYALPFKAPFNPGAG